MPSLDKLILGSTLYSISQPVTRKQRFGRGQHASCLLSLPGFHLGVLRASSAWEQHSTTAHVNAPSSNLLYFPFLKFCLWSGILSDNWQAVAWLLIVILVGFSFQRAPSAFWVFAFISAVPRAQLAWVPVHGRETEALWRIMTQQG